MQGQSYSAGFRRLTLFPKELEDIYRHLTVLWAAQLEYAQSSSLEWPVIEVLSIGVRLSGRN